MTSKVYNKQIGGNHYMDMVMQPSEFINKNKLQFAELDTRIPIIHLRVQRFI